MNSMNLIDRDKLIERLEISGCETCRFGGEYCVDCKLIDAHRVLSAIESLPTVNEWIPVSELPKESIDFKSDELLCVVKSKGNLYNELCYYEFDEELWRNGDMIPRNVIAYMPIPEYTN